MVSRRGLTYAGESKERYARRKKKGKAMSWPTKEMGRGKCVGRRKGREVRVDKVDDDEDQGAGKGAT
jgi:hypothetical protein